MFTKIKTFFKDKYKTSKKFQLFIKAVIVLVVAGIIINTFNNAW